VVSLTAISQYSHLVTYYILGLIDLSDCVALFSERAETNGSESRATLS